MYKSLVSKSEGRRFTVRAPLATFDTIDLGEDIAFIQSGTSANDETISGSSDETNNIDVIRKRTIFGSHDSPKFEPSNTHVYEKLGDSPSGGNNAKDNSKSENKNREFMNQRPSPEDSLSDSSDSDNGYIQSGYLSMTDGRITKHDFPAKIPTSPFPSRNSRVGDQDVSQDNTPTSSPSLQRSPLPVLLQELEHVKLQSKRKALEKRIQRLQVTNRPVERPRSTTPIHVVTLDEYKEINSPEKYQTPDHLEKLKIKLPAEDFSCSRQRSPWKARSSISEASNVFSFNEEHLFTHTKSAFLLQNDGSVGQSPKRIFIPPSLSPALSPAASPAKAAVTSNSPPLTASPKFYYNPTLKSQSRPPSHQHAVSNLVRDNWIAFDDKPRSQNTTPAKNQSITETSESAKDTNNDKQQTCVQEKSSPNTKSGKLTDAVIEDAPTAKAKLIIPKIVEHPVCNSEQEEILTINIEEFNNGTKICNIQCESISEEIGNEVCDNVLVSDICQTAVTGDVSRDKVGVGEGQELPKQEGVAPWQEPYKHSSNVASNDTTAEIDSKHNTLSHTNNETVESASSHTENQSLNEPSPTHVNGKHMQRAELPEHVTPIIVDTETTPVTSVTPAVTPSDIKSDLSMCTVNSDPKPVDGQVIDQTLQ